MNTALGIIAVLGLIIALIGRWMIGAEARAIGLGWLYAIRFVPLADVMFLARYWELAKTGAFTSMTGLLLILPWGAKKVWDETHAPPTPPGTALKHLDGDQRNSIFITLQNEHEAALEQKENKLRALNAKMAPWYSSMQTRRAAVKTEQELAAFNEEAAAYSALHQITKKEAAELAKLQAVRLTSWGDLTDEQVAYYFALQAKQSAKLGSTKGKPGAVVDDF